MSDLVKYAFRHWGYLQADLDPFKRITPIGHRDLDTATGPVADEFRSHYCGKIGVEFMHIPYPDRIDWLAQKFESSRPATPDPNFVFRRLASAKLFESFLHIRYVGTKRFSLEGTTALIPLMDSIMERAADSGFEYIMIGMSHRGRLNVVHHIACIEPSTIFVGFEDVDPRSMLGSGDVKYHKGATGIYETQSGKKLEVHLGSNPSHLEAINPVLTGRARARQNRLSDRARKKVLVVLLHGDAAFAGQGVTAETLNYADLPGFRVGGTIHIIVNNLIGFTAKPRYLHSGHFASDVAKRLPIPIFHINGESPDEVVWAGATAMDYRATFQSDVVLDLIGYRRYGHNEADDPSITSPALYEQIKEHTSLHHEYARSHNISEENITQAEEQLLQKFEEGHRRAQTLDKYPALRALPDYWSNYVGGPYSNSFEVETAVSHERLLAVTNCLANVPEGFSLNPKVIKLLEQRKEMGAGKRAVDWGMAELLAFGSLLSEGVPVRVTGQDSRRGTFASRHAVYYDTKTEEQYIPLCHLSPEQGKFDIYDSMLSEFAALGFEYGFSREYPEALVCWEAQFGDFVNGAQTIIDQFISAAEDKWSILTGLTVLLPHGFEGQGPEHSSARIERFLQLAAEDNMQICYPSTAAQYFHLLRRQVLRKWRKPLIVFTPKSMLRAKPASSLIADFTSGKFQLVIDDLPEFHSASRILVGSAKIVHELKTERAKRKESDVAILSIEQLYPFPDDELGEILAQYKNARSLVWVQEEPANMGALFFVRPYLEQIFGAKNVTSVKRSPSASPATGSPKAHSFEQETILKFAFAKFS